MNYSTFIKEKLVSLINEMDQYHWLFTRNAEKEFSRIKKWSFGEIMRFIISMEGKSLKDELLEHFNFSVDTGVCDIVFWMEIGDFENWEGADFEDQPENTVVTEPYMSVSLWWAVLADSPVVNVYRDQ